jgi:pyruvate kinase
VSSHAKIICTIGPATNTAERIRQLIQAGMRIARLNFSHATHADHAKVIRIIRDESKRLGIAVAILQDLQGPKIRLGKVAEGTHVLRPDDTFILTSKSIIGNRSISAVTYKKLPDEVKPGDTIFMNDGIMELKVVRIKRNDVHCKVIQGGLIGSHMGLNLPSTKLSAPSMTAKDMRDLAFGIKMDVDYVALSFVKEAADIHALRRRIQKLGGHARIIAKLELALAVTPTNLDPIIDAADAIMVARGDLGVELPPEEVPLTQKRIIRHAFRLAKPVIVATQMLETMTTNPRPTRAEVSDVANAIFDGTDAVMLSGETARGKHPIQAVRMMSRIVERTESAISQRRISTFVKLEENIPVAEHLCYSASLMAQELKVKAIVVFTESGATARYMSKFHPKVPIHTLSPKHYVVNQSQLLWGVNPMFFRRGRHSESLLRRMEHLLLSQKLVNHGDKIILLLGMPLTTHGPTNTIKVHTIH